MTKTSQSQYQLHGTQCTTYCDGERTMLDDDLESYDESQNIISYLSQHKRSTA